MTRSKTESKQEAAKDKLEAQEKTRRKSGQHTQVSVKDIRTFFEKEEAVIWSNKVQKS